ncbi:hypothetical protein [Arthrobacter sp. Helios]|uniref:8-oxoguanine DNA glycosylase OGG fold protein n=1 Tax=Arthrobacter sp. Helios TaxID=2828862 RepID=UPI002066AD39|nr:hypothetical protein [Arthrobacter sp. Helios]UPO76399.1 hypothetical protein ArtHe_13745 [Arthrobacter sp. Helios]
MSTVETGIPAVLATRLSAEQAHQKAFLWNRAKWEPLVSDIPDAAAALKDLPNELDRDAVRGAVQGNLVRERVLGALVPVLIWGGPGRYGPYRARRILTAGTNTAGGAVETDIREQLIKAGDIVRDENAAAEAFRFMNNEGRIKFLGPAFFTKWLAFSSMTDSVDGKNVAPILDKRVRDWIFQNTRGTDQINLRTTSTAHYQRYLDLLDAWGGPYGRTRAQVELAIFDLTRDRPAV